LAYLERASEFIPSFGLAAVIAPAEMAEEMSGRKPTFCCSKDGLTETGRIERREG
jgi:hypothetical protein